MIRIITGICLWLMFIGIKILFAFEIIGDDGMYFVMDNLFTLIPVVLILSGSISRSFEKYEKGKHTFH